MTVSAYNARSPLQQDTDAASITELLRQATVVALVDLLGFFSHRPLPRGTLRYLEELIGEEIFIEEKRDKKTNKLLGYIYRIPRPHKHLRALNDWVVRNKVTVSWFDIAFDFRFNDSCPMLTARSRLSLHLYIRRGAKRQRFIFEDSGNFYSSDTVNDKKVPRGCRGYVRPGARCTLRIELMLFRAATIRRYVRTPIEILDYDPADIFENEFCLRFVNPSYVKRWEQEWLAAQERMIITGKAGKRRRRLKVRPRRFKAPVRVFDRLAGSPHVPTVIKPINLGKDIEWAPLKPLFSL